MYMAFVRHQVLQCGCSHQAGLHGATQERAPVHDRTITNECNEWFYYWCGLYFGVGGWIFKRGSHVVQGQSPF